MPDEEDIIIALYCAIADVIPYDHRHSRGKLWLSEILLCGVLLALKGGSFSQFYRWLSRRRLLILPERSRRLRLIKSNHHRTDLFLVSPELFNIADTVGVEVIHPVREGRSDQSLLVSDKGKSNHRWIVGRKVHIVVSREGIIAWANDTANIHDQTFNVINATVNGIVLTDNGYRDKNGVPWNVKICPKGTWNDRMFVETLFSLWKRMCHAKSFFVRSVKAFWSKFAFLVALTNILFALNKKEGYTPCSFAQWAL